MSGAAGLLLLLVGLSGAPGAAQAALVDPAAEAANIATSQQRQTQFSSPAFFAEVAAATIAQQNARQEAVRRDPERAPDPNTCTTIALCPVDPRLERFAEHDLRREPVTFTARNGATLSGSVWASRRGPAKRPGVLIVNGPTFGFEQAYWYAAQSLAQAGYVVLTFDAQGQGASDQLGEAPDRGEGSGAGTPLIGTNVNRGTFTGFGGSGLSFYDGGADALDFFVSTPERPYAPVPSRTSGTSHAAKQRRRVAAGLNPAANPLAGLLDPARIGIVGHSYGAQAASWLAQKDPRLKTAVAWDTLCTPDRANLDELEGFLGEGGNASPTRCVGAPESAPTLTKPALGITGDYFLPAPFLAAPDPLVRQRPSQRLSQAGVDSGQVVIRGGTDIDFTDTPSGLLPATRRGIDLIAWYTTAWLDVYVKGDPTAQGRLLSDRWRADAEAGAHDPRRDANMLSYHFRSRLDVGRRGGQRAVCEDLRGGCERLVAADDDCGPRGYGFVAVATRQIPADTCNAAPRASASGRRLGTRRPRYRFDARGSADADGEVRRYSWRIGRRVLSSRARFTRTFAPRRRAVTVRLTVVDDEGARTTRRLRIHPRQR